MANNHSARKKAKRNSSALAIGLGAVLAIGTLVTLAWLGWIQYDTIVQTDRQRGEMQARVLEDHATRSVDNVAVALKYLARDIEQAKVSAGPTSTHQALMQAMITLPNVRSLSVVDPNGRVLSSSAPSDLGLEIDIDRLAKLPLPGKERLADFVHGRSLGALARNAPAADAKSGIGFIPLIYGLNTAHEGDLYLVALINPDSFSSFQLLTLNDLRNSAYLISYQGSILASSGTTSLTPGERVSDHPVLKTYLPGIEHASYLGMGSSPDKQVVAFRLSKSRPLVVVIEQPYASSLSRWLDTMRWFAMAAGLTMLFLAFMTTSLVRTLRARERTHAELEVARLELEHQLAFVALLLDISPTPVSTMDSAGRYLSVNRAWEDFKGRSRTEVVGHKAKEFLPLDEIKRHSEYDERVWASGQSIRYEDSLLHSDGSRRDVVITKLLVPGNERFSARLLNTIVDVSEFREAERATREARDAAQESSLAKSEFIANISHELRTPLQSILGFSELGIMRGSQHPKLHAMFTDINASGSRMLALVNDLLDMSKIESAVGTIKLESVDVRGLVNDVIRELNPQVNAQSLHLDIALDDQPLIAQIDPARFAQVIRNVAANAIKFSPTGSSIEITATETADRQILIRVRDHGPGIPPTERETIFDAFVQSSRTKDGSGGTGLGLAICRKILAAHHGSISADNMPDGGAAFTILLPARRHLNQEIAC